eukprot:1025907-Pelagomonas_calceolata.AAC.4
MAVDLAMYYDSPETLLKAFGSCLTGLPEGLNFPAPMACISLQERLLHDTSKFKVPWLALHDTSKWEQLSRLALHETSKWGQLSWLASLQDRLLHVASCMTQAKLHDASKWERLSRLASLQDRLLHDASKLHDTCKAA